MVAALRHVIAVGAVAVVPLACSADPGADGSSILAPYAALSGGIIFSTQDFSQGKGYDLYWVAAPAMATINPQIAIRLTSEVGNEWQPSVSSGGNGIVFTHEDDGIFLISTSGRVTRVASSTDQYKMSHPAISRDGARVAWVREDRKSPIGTSGFFENAIMMANFDGKNPLVLQPKAGVIQDAPVFDPAEKSTRLAWSEFNANTLAPTGPVDFGVFIYDYVNQSGHYACKNPAVAIGDRLYRCFGQHLAWPAPNLIVTAQDMLEVHLDQTGPPTTIWEDFTTSIIRQEVGTPDVGSRTNGFFPRFPISISYSAGLDRFVVDGVLQPHDLNQPTNSYFIGNIQPGLLGVGQVTMMNPQNGELGGVWRLPIDNYAADIDTVNTADYLFSVATPQFVP